MKGSESSTYGPERGIERDGVGLPRFYSCQCASSAESQKDSTATTGIHSSSFPTQHPQKVLFFIRKDQESYVRPRTSR